MLKGIPAKRRGAELGRLDMALCFVKSRFTRAKSNLSEACEGHLLQNHRVCFGAGRLSLGNAMEQEAPGLPTKILPGRTSAHMSETLQAGAA